MAKLTDEEKAIQIIETHGLDSCVLYLLGTELERECSYILDIVDNKKTAMKIILRQFRLNGNEKLTYIDNYTKLKDDEIVSIIIASEEQGIKGSVGETKIEQYLIKNKIPYIKEFTFKNLKRKRFDFYLLKDNICIEFDGIQHFKPISYFGGVNAFINTKNNDIIKNDYCKNNKIKLIRIPYTEENNINKILDLELKGD